MPPESWNSQWQVALFEAKKETPFLKSGISSVEFGQLAGVSSGNVSVHAARGKDHFRKRFAEDCDFWEVEKSKMQHCLPYRRLFTFYGTLHPAELYRYGLWLLTLEDFAKRQTVALEEVQRLVRKGHEAFRERFPEWEFFTRKQYGQSPLEYWFGRIEDLGAREDANPIPEDFLTTEQFARLQGLEPVAVFRATRAGREAFQARFPGWSFFGLRSQRFRFVRLGDAAELLTIQSFMKRAGITFYQLKTLLEQGQFSQTFPGYRAQGTGFKSVRWIIFRQPGAKLWEPPAKAMPIARFAKIVQLPLATLNSYLKNNALNQVFPGWQAVQRPRNMKWFLYPADADAPNPPLSAVELYGLFSMQEASVALEVSSSRVEVWVSTPRLLREKAPGWTVVRLTFRGKSVWLKPPQCLLTERPEA
ncbi:hypothetical protein [Halomicronema sp. CCY15110]|uniref:hypothetical protein n=1 Tax=Halomicronema sp. CCY15110 TaxID=2767773 RepID=UPI001951677E|nr:hypothetical protein [Halomicronema sp. CCY15110]